MQGEAYVQQGLRKKSTKSLTMHTHVGNVVATDAEFVIKTYPNSLITSLKSGQLKLYSKYAKKTLTLNCVDDLGSITQKYVGDKLYGDSLAYFANHHFEIASNWMNATRKYKNIPLRTFIEEMSRWDGFTIKNMHCIPDTYVNIEICYLTNRSETFAAIRNTGQKVYVHQGKVSFCPEENENRLAQKVPDQHKFNSGGY